MYKGSLMLTFLGILLFAIAFFFFKAIVIVPQSYSYTLERFGKYVKTLQPGLHFIIPFFESIGRQINMMEQVLDINSQEVISKDNAMVKVDGVCYFRIIEPSFAAYRVFALEPAIENLTITSIRSVLGALDLDSMLSQRDMINEKLLQIVDDATNDWGVKVTRIEIKDIMPPQDLVDAMAGQMKAERERRARILEAEGFRQAEILQGEGHKQAMILAAEGEKRAEVLKAEARERSAQAEAMATEVVSKAISQGDQKALQYFVAQKYVEAFSTIANSEQSKTVLMPYEATGVLSSLAGVAELLGDMKGKGSK